MRGPLNRIFATTGSMKTQMKIASRYAYAALRHGTPKKWWNAYKVWRARARGDITVDGFPFVLKIESTNICNLECPFCLDRDRSQFKGDGMRGFGRMKADFFKRVIDQLGPYAFNVNMYGSGEPLLFPEAYEMMRYAADKNVGVRISSNLSMRDFDDAMAEKVVTSGIEHLIVSCHGASQETYEKYMVGGNFERVTKNMRKLVDAKKRLGKKLPFIDWQFLLFRHNQHEVKKAQAMADDIGVDFVRFIYPNIPPEFKEEWKPRAEGEASDYQPVPNAPANGAAKATQNGANAPVAAPASAAPQHAPQPAVAKKQPRINVESCSWPYYSIYFNWDGGILPCCDGTTKPSYDLGKFSETTDINDIWNGPDYQLVRRYANFEIAPQDMDARYTCASCLKPLAPFLIKQKGLPLDPAIEKKVDHALAHAKQAFKPAAVAAKT
ncbi:MAG: radical SAM protein [Planctomycetes bacterium]|nr:radical SAM protein [Planctomycetota bacterium]